MGQVAQVSLNRRANELLVPVLDFQQLQQSPWSGLWGLYSLCEITEGRRAAEIKDLSSVGKDGDRRNQACSVIGDLAMTPACSQVCCTWVEDLLLHEVLCWKLKLALKTGDSLIAT